ncbi:hypothetical protein [Enterobacter cloacae]|uniref:hypothetical protein n=1 Tax=Enterobacter cloacae TaxID=550 RepID=UPI002A3AD754|nr:hypothetical protein [Enterobacter cloacae]
MKHRNLTLVALSLMLSANASAVVGTDIKSATGTVEFTAPQILSHSIDSVTGLTAGSHSTVYNVGKGTISTDMNSRTVVRPGPSHEGYPDIGQAFYVNGTSNPQNKIVLSLATNVTGDQYLPWSGEGAWLLVPEDNIYYINASPGVVQPDTYTYTIDAATYSN